MMKSIKRTFQVFQATGYISLLLGLVSILACVPSPTPGGCGEEPAPSPTGVLPIVFVHGGAGSADQFSLQAQRFASNGYPAGLISGFEWDSTLENNTMAEILTGLDEHIDAVLAEHGAQQVYLVGHSMGTMMSMNYLNASSQRAAKVARYASFDGRVAAQLPGGVPTVAIWAPMSGGAREITGATNVTLPGQTHVQSVSSAEAFSEIYKFFLGKAPETVQVLPEATAAITLAGKMTMFATNLIPVGYTIDVYEVVPGTGARMDQAPVYSQAIAADGSFGFKKAQAGTTYEFATHSTANPGMTQHFYYEPFIRSDLLLRLKLSETNGTLSSMVDVDAGQTNMTIVRNKELVGDAQDYPEQAPLVNDSLTVNGEELCRENATPAANRTIGLYVFDAGSDGRSNVAQAIEAFASIPFVSGVDLFIPAAPPAATVSVMLKGRQNGGRVQEINVPNWSSATDKVTVQFRAF